ncbi:SDR family oxidoreductase [Frigoribacterium sp. CFBP 13729]|uniref:SDR family oxidoreductase n=1 Tax=unclassified Frigoribacterium TaxID=2627005 RepID=UPI001785D287|nr:MULTISPECIES: SDR family oxidoreductase [unclassified Frigoribacterium]MBD8583153.1 SDR family oxidoreductase [Frigoribacterium sp. CFBP 8766]MBD8611068.1 SDR family oxidoreductase [Frigoribacterium sp. CFBP 13729]
MSTDASRPTALVTGATRGIGLAVARDLSRTHHVVVHGRDEEALVALADSLPSATPWVADLAGSPFEAPALDRLDVVVHAAGVIGGGTVEGTSRDDWRRVFEVNVFAVSELTRQLLPALRAAQGTVVAINSGSGFAAGPGGSTYAASKFALRALTDSLREEERRHGVRVSSVHPGRVDTDMQHELVESEGGLYDVSLYLEPQSVADAVRLVVDLPHGATAEVVSVRPTRRA